MKENEYISAIVAKEFDSPSHEDVEDSKLWIDGIMG